MPGLGRAPYRDLALESLFLAQSSKDTARGLRLRAQGRRARLGWASCPCCRHDPRQHEDGASGIRGARETGSAVSVRLAVPGSPPVTGRRLRFRGLGRTGRALAKPLADAAHPSPALVCAELPLRCLRGLPERQVNGSCFLLRPRPPSHQRSCHLLSP